MDRKNLLLGTITFGQQTNLEMARQIVEIAVTEGFGEIDAAYVYNGGECERILGEILKDIPRESFRIATKVNPRITGKLDREAIFMQQNESLKRLRTEYSDVMYLHFPDLGTPVEHTLEACQELYEKGSFRELGLSNFSADDVILINRICRDNGWVSPTVYEGVYNALSRKAEGELFTVLREHDMRFVAYNPLAGGMLTGKYRSFDDMPSEGRFKERESYKRRYWREAYFAGVNIVRQSCEAEDIRMADASMRWLEYHSQLKIENNDGIIIGSSKPSQLLMNIESLDHGPLPASVQKAFDEAWALCSEDSPEYFRSFDK